MRIKRHITRLPVAFQNMCLCGLSVLKGISHYWDLRPFSSNVVSAAPHTVQGSGTASCCLREGQSKFLQWLGTTAVLWGYAKRKALNFSTYTIWSTINHGLALPCTQVPDRVTSTLFLNLTSQKPAACDLFARSYAVLKRASVSVLNTNMFVCVLLAAHRSVWSQFLWEDRRNLSLLF